MIDQKIDPEIQRILNKFLSKTENMAYFSSHDVKYKIISLPKKERKILNNYLLSLPSNELGKISSLILDRNIQNFKNKFINNFPKELKNIQKVIKYEEDMKERRRKEKILIKQRQEAARKAEEERARINKNLAQNKNIFSALGLSEEQKKMLKQMIDTVK